MKKILLAVALMISMTGFSQSTAKIQKQQQKKAVKEAVKSSKEFAKDGWKVSIGALPLELQLNKSFLMLFETDEAGATKYISSEAMSIGGNYDGAKMQAINLAIENAATILETRVTALIKNSVSNEQLKAEEAETITKTVRESKNLIIQDLGTSVFTVEAYRILDNKNYQALVRVFYPTNKAMQAAKRVVENNSGVGQEQLNNIFN